MNRIVSSHPRDGVRRFFAYSYYATQLVCLFDDIFQYAAHARTSANTNFTHAHFIDKQPIRDVCLNVNVLFSSLVTR